MSKKDDTIAELKRINKRQLKLINELKMKYEPAPAQIVAPPPTKSGEGQLTLTITGAHDTGRSTLASLIKSYLDETGYTDVNVLDTPATKNKRKFQDRWKANRARRIDIKVVLR